MAPVRAPAGFESRLAAEFRADWSDRQKALDASIQQSSSAFAVQGLGRSGGLIKEHARLIEEALDDARSMLVQRASLLLVATKTDLRDRAILARLPDVVAAELKRLAADFEQSLSRESQNMGLGNLAPSLQSKVKSLLTTLETELDAALAASGPQFPPHAAPWYQRPLGYVILTAIAGLLVWLATKVLSR